MRIDAVSTVAKREYLTRVKSKGFWIATLLLPIAMAALTILPSMIAMKAKASHRLALVDEVGGLGERIAAELERSKKDSPAEGVAEAASRNVERADVTVELVPLAADRTAMRTELDRRVLAGEIDSWLWISDQGLAANEVEYHAESVSNFITQGLLERVVSRVVAEVRLARAGIDARQVAELTHDVDLQTVRVSAEGSREEGGMAGFFLAYFLFFLLYMVVMLYGQQVMNGVLEEKSSRIVEVLLASVRPLELMVGKLVGIGAAGLTQLVIWLVTMVTLSAPAVLTALAIAPAGAQLPRVSGMLMLHFLILFLLGFGIFATLYAAVGAATNNVQEAQQYVGFLVIFLIIPMFLVIPIINDPDSTLAVVLSMTPVFTPLLMMLRIAVKMPPLWQILTSYVLTAATVAFLVWVCSRIYRIGILMYGKKPTFQELWRWIRYA
ncbi:MAG: ABC transporter permease [Thermoanaerobaculia bacterium]